jgi:hypothetical protein
MLSGEVVNGVVIGEMETREYYRFYSRKDGRLLWDAGHFSTDLEAILCFWDHFRADKRLVRQYEEEGVEMRVWKP